MPDSDSDDISIGIDDALDADVSQSDGILSCVGSEAPIGEDEEVVFFEEDADELPLAEPAPLQPNDVVINGFVAQYNEAMADFGNLSLDEAAVRARIGALTAGLGAEDIDDYRLEDFSAALFHFPDIQLVLNQLNGASGALGDADSQRLRNMVLDLCLFSALVPTREKRRKVLGNFSEYSRYTIQVLTPRQVHDALDGMRHLGFDPNINNAGVFDALHLDDGDTIKQRMVKMSLLSTPIAGGQRAGAFGDPAFQHLLASPSIARTLFASTGADEQYFLNTCPISARNTDMAARTSNLITLLRAGEKLTADLRQEILNGPPATTGRRLTIFQTVGRLVTKRCDDADAVFLSIRNELDAMLQHPDEFDYGRVKELRRDWSRAMQKLGGVVSWNDPDAIPQLSKKYVRDHYYGSAVLAAFAGLTVNFLLPNTRTMSRVMGPDSERYTFLTSQTIESREGNNDVRMSEFAGGYEGLWNHLYKNGGSPFSANSAAGFHSLYIKAVMRNGQRTFAINDPMQRSFEYKTMAQMDDYARGAHAPRLQI